MSVSAAELRTAFPETVAHGLDEEALALLGRALERVRVRPGHRVTEYGHPTDKLYFIAGGARVRATLPGPDEESLTDEEEAIDLAPHRAREWVGELGVMKPGPASASVTVVHPGELWALTSRAFHEMCFPAELRLESPSEEAREIGSRKLQVADRLLDLFLDDLSARVRTTSAGVLFEEEPGRWHFEPVEGERRPWLGFLGRLLGFRR